MSFLITLCSRIPASRFTPWRKPWERQCAALRNSPCSLQAMPRKSSHDREGFSPAQAQAEASITSAGHSLVRTREQHRQSTVLGRHRARRLRRTTSSRSCAWEHKVSDAGAKALSKALESNVILKVLCLNSDKVSDEDAKALSKAVASSYILTVLCVHSTRSQMRAPGIGQGADNTPSPRTCA